MRYTELEKRIAAIEVRNKRVELDKAWETSWIRKLVLLLVTLFFTYIFLLLIHDDHAFGNAVLGAIGFLLSTLTVSYLKAWWIAKQ